MGFQKTLLKRKFLVVFKYHNFLERKPYESWIRKLKEDKRQYLRFANGLEKFLSFRRNACFEGHHLFPAVHRRRRSGAQVQGHDERAARSRHFSHEGGRDRRGKGKSREPHWAHFYFLISNICVVQNPPFSYYHWWFQNLYIRVIITTLWSDKT